MSALVLLAVSLVAGYQSLWRPSAGPPTRLVGARLGRDQAMAPPPDHFDAPAAPSAPPPAALRSPFGNLAPGSGTWAVTIGIDDYPGTNHDLRSARADADDVDRALLAAGVPGDHIVAVHDTQASAAVIRLAAQWLVARAGPDSLAVFFYAGHARRLGPTTQAVVGADAQLVTDRELAALLAPLKARQAWIGMASCYGAGFDELLAPGRVLTGAAPANALAYENSGFGRSYMVEYMIRQAMLEQRAPGSVQGAFAYARSSIAQDYPGREPVEIDDNAGPISFGGPALALGAASPTAGDGRPAPAEPSPAPDPSAPSPGAAGDPTTTTTIPPRKGCVPTPVGRVCR